MTVLLPRLLSGMLVLSDLTGVTMECQLRTYSSEHRKKKKTVLANTVRWGSQTPATLTIHTPTNHQVIAQLLFYENTLYTTLPPQWLQCAGTCQLTPKFPHKVS